MKTDLRNLIGSSTICVEDIVELSNNILNSNQEIPETWKESKTI